MNSILQIKQALKNAITTSRDKATMFFKTGHGHYAQDDQFIGVTVPNIRIIAKRFYNISLDDIASLIISKINEERLLALIILVNQYQKSEAAMQEKIYQLYLQNMQHVNNWNLVDASAHYIIGAHLFNNNRDKLLVLARSEIMWERRIAIVSTWYFIKKNDLNWTFKIAELLLHDTHDLIHKAVGWMLREAGKRNQAELIIFLDQYAARMPRTTLRYAIEKLSEEERKIYLLKSKKLSSLA